MRWNRSIMLAAALTLPLAACATEGDEAGTDEAEIEVEAPDRPDVIVEEEQPDVIVEERERDVPAEEEGFEADVNVDEEGNVTGGVRVEDREP